MAAFSDQTEALNTRRKVQDRVQEMIARQREMEPEPGNSGDTDNVSVSVWSVFDKFMSENITIQPGTPFSKASKEVQMYVDDDILLRKDSQGRQNCPRKWWQMHRNVYPNLAEIYRTNCNIVGTSVPCERMFSKTGLIVSDRRSCLKTEKVRQLMFLNVNMDQQRFNSV